MQGPAPTRKTPQDVLKAITDHWKALGGSSGDAYLNESLKESSLFRAVAQGVSNSREIISDHVLQSVLSDLKMNALRLRTASTLALLSPQEQVRTLRSEPLFEELWAEAQYNSNALSVLDHDAESMAAQHMTRIISEDPHFTYIVLRELHREKARARTWSNLWDRLKQWLTRKKDSHGVTIQFPLGDIVNAPVLLYILAALTAILVAVTHGNSATDKRLRALEETVQHVSTRVEDVAKDVREEHGLLTDLDTRMADVQGFGSRLTSISERVDRAQSTVDTVRGKVDGLRDKVALLATSDLLTLQESTTRSAVATATDGLGQRIDKFRDAVVRLQTDLRTLATKEGQLESRVHNEDSTRLGGMAVLDTKTTVTDHVRLYDFDTSGGIKIRVLRLTLEAINRDGARITVEEKDKPPVRHLTVPQGTTVDVPQLGVAIRFAVNHRPWFKTKVGIFSVVPGTNETSVVAER